MKLEPNVSGVTLRRALSNAPPYADEVWTTLDGRQIAVGKMDEQHVRNALRLVLRQRRAVREAWRRHQNADAVNRAIRRENERAAEEERTLDRIWGN